MQLLTYQQKMGYGVNSGLKKKTCNENLFSVLKRCKKRYLEFNDIKTDVNQQEMK